MDMYESRIRRLEQQVGALRAGKPARIVHAEYTTNTAQAMTNNDYTLLDYEDKIIDTHGAVTVGASWKFTAPIPGPYNIAAASKLAADAGWDIGERVSLELYKNGASVKILGYNSAFDNAGGESISMFASGAKTIYLNTYDYISFYFFQDSGGAINLNGLATNNWCSITLVGESR